MIKDNGHSLGNNGADFGLPDELLSFLPADPYEQLDIARKITSMAVASRVSRLESETGRLRQRLAEKERTVIDLQQKLVEVEHTLEETTTRLSHALDEQMKLTNERNTLSASVRKLNRDVAKLETFKRTLMQSLQEDDDPPNKLENIEKLAMSRASALDTPARSDYASNGGLSSSRGDNVSNGTRSQGVFPPNSHLTPSDSPKKLGGPASPRRQSAPGSPRRQASSETRFRLPFSQPASNFPTAPNSPPPAGSLPVRTPKVDGKEFFRQARSRLSYEQFSAFLTNIKELNAHRQTREETMKKASEIFGLENKDLYASFEGLLSRHLPT